MTNKYSRTTGGTKKDKAFIAIEDESEQQQQQQQARRVIWKYHLDLDDSGMAQIEMPQDAKILTVQLQREEAMLWALVNPDPKIKKKTRYFVVVGTGHDWPEEFWTNLIYISTFQPEGGRYVFHAFEDVTFRGIDFSK